MEKLTFLDSKTGWAMTRKLSDQEGLVFLKTEDGGTNWTPSVILPGEDGRDGALKFADDSTGILRTSRGRVFRTTDGGATWTGVTGQIDGKAEIAFSDPDVGWMLRGQKMLYTTNSGLSWTSRDVLFPSPATAFTLVRRDSGYAVGEHGMVYRYSVVPANYNGAGPLPAAAMPH